MAALHKLSALTVKNARVGKYCDGGGLWLVKTASGGGKWVLRLSVHGRRREMGLGSLREVSLKRARELAAHWRGVAAAGRDPVKERAAQLREQARADTSLRTITMEAFEARKAELKGDGKAGRWLSPLELHILPRLGRTPIEELDQRDLRDALAPIWHDKADTARKAANRLSIVFKHAAAMGLQVDLQVVDKAKALLGRSRHQARHIEALHWREVPEFYASLAEPSVTHLALRLLVLTGVRSRPIRFLHLDQLDGDVWTIPAELMKGRIAGATEFRVPLSDEAQRVIALAEPFARDGYLFPSARKGVISDATMARLMERRGLAARPHGFRTSLRTWLADKTDASHELAEMVMAHKVGTTVSRAYQRSDRLDERRDLLARWARHVIGDRDDP